MNTTNTRIKKLRKALDLTQQAFADRLGMKQNTIATYEMGRSKPGTPTINNICREFHVNEVWLRTGEGEMFQPAPRDAIDELIEQYRLPREYRTLTEKFIDLKPEQQEAVIEYMRNIAIALATEENSGEIPAVWNQSAAADDPPNQQAMWEAEARAEAEELYQQILEQKKAEAGYSASPPTDCGGSGGVA